MSVESFIPKVATGNFRQACVRIGLNPNKTSLTEYAIKRYGLVTKHPEKLGISQLYNLINANNAKTPAEIAKISGDKPLSYMLLNIIG